MTLIFNSAKNRATQEPIPFTLDEKVYQFTPPETTALALAEGTTEQLRTQLNWLEAGLPDEQAKEIRARLLDPRDDLAAVDLVRIINGLLEAMSGRPTGPSPD